MISKLIFKYVSLLLFFAMAAGSVAQAADPLIDRLAGQGGAVAPPPNVPGASKLRPDSSNMVREEVPVNEVQKAWDDPKTAPGQVTPGIRLWNYSPQKVERIRIRPAAWTMIYLPEWEEAQDFYVGDDYSFDVRMPMAEQGMPTRRNVLLIRPKSGVVRADTTLQIIGRQVEGFRNVYTALLRSESVKDPVVTDLTVFVEAGKPGRIGTAFGPASYLGAFSTTHNGVGTAPSKAHDLPPPPPANTMPGTPVYPPAASAAPREPVAQAKLGTGAPDWMREVPFDLATLRFGEYEVAVKDDESAKIAPIRVLSDDRFTILDFGEGRADNILKPTVFRVVDDVDSLVNTRTSGPAGNLLVVESVGYNLTLRNGQRVVCIRYLGKALDLPRNPDVPIRKMDGGGDGAPARDDVQERPKTGWGSGPAPIIVNRQGNQ